MVSTELIQAQAAARKQAPRWQAVRAKAIDATFDADRRRVGERVAVVFRWLFLIVLAALNNFNPRVTAEARFEVDALLFVWAVMNVTVQVILVRGYRPGKQFSLTTMVLDIFFAAALVYLSNGFNSPFFLALFLAVITNAVRFGATASFVSALVVSLLYLFIGGSFTPANFSISANATIGQMFLFLVVALATGYMTRELERERRSAVGRAAQADTLRELSMSLVGDTDIKDVFDVLIGHAVQMTSAEHGRVVVTSPDGFAVVAAANREAAEVVPESESYDEREIAQAAATGEAVFSTDRLSMIVPIASSEGATVVVLLRQSKVAFTNQDLFAVDALTGSSAVPVANALRYQRTMHEATTDGLTGLVNAREFRRRLDIAFARPDRRDFPLSLLLIDFDHFKSVNDLKGHQHGDLVLQMGARIVRGAVRGQDVVARYGGDELAVIVPDASGAAAQRLAYRIVDAVHGAAISTTAGHQLTFSIGVATYPEDGLDATELINAADQALYLAKREGKDRPCTFPQLVTELELATSELATILTDAGPQIMVAVAHAVDHRNPVAQGHSSRVVSVADAIARRAAFSSSGLETLRIAAYLHDAGHMTMPSGGEAFEAPGHPEEGGRIASVAQFPIDVVLTIRHHHDRWDGVGNADGAARDSIPLMARILAVAERFEALTAGRECLRVSPAAALLEVQAGVGTQFDPGVVEALARAVREGSLELNVPAIALPAVASSEPLAAAGLNLSSQAG
jgi:diguanylate cyclase (GGDEF)-like protein